MSLIVVDVEADGAVPPKYSMVCFGAVIVDKTLGKTFLGKTKPISPHFNPQALAVSGYGRKEHEGFDSPFEVMINFKNWIRENSVGRPTFISDNPAFDWQWINYYFHTYIGENPFGFSARRIGDLYCGFKADMGLNKEWKRKYRVTRHTHNPVDDAMGNAEALLAMSKLGIKGII